MNDQDEIEVMDQQGNRKTITRGEYAQQSLTAARQYWDNLEAMRHFTVQFLQDGFPAQSLETAEQAVALSKGNVRDLYFRAVAQAEIGLLREAAANFEEIREDAAYPADVARATAGLGRVRARQERPEEAEALLNEAVDTDPDNPSLMVELFAFMHSLERGQEAVAKVRATASKLPRACGPHRALGQIATMMGDRDGIRAAVHEAVARATQQELGDVMAEAGMFLGQSGQAQEIVNLMDPRRSEIQHPVALMNLAQAYAEVGRKDDARQLLTSLQAGAPPQMRPAIQMRLEQLDGLTGA